MKVNKIVKLKNKVKKVYKMIDEILCDLYDMELNYPAPAKAVTKTQAKRSAKKVKAKKKAKKQ